MTGVLHTLVCRGCWPAICQSGSNVSSYNDDSLRQLLELWGEKDGHLSSDQIQALLDWENTPDDARRALEVELAERGPEPDLSPAPVTAQRDLLREGGLDPERESESRSKFQRFGSAIRGLFSR